MLSFEKTSRLKRSIGRFVERHLLIEWCLKPSKKYISTKTLYNLMYALVQFFWNRPMDPMGFSFKHMFDHQALEEWILLSASSNILPSLWGCTKPHLPEPDRPISLRKNAWIKALLNHHLGSAEVVLNFAQINQLQRQPKRHKLCVGVHHFKKDHIWMTSNYYIPEWHITWNPPKNKTTLPKKRKHHLHHPQPSFLGGGFQHVNMLIV